MLNIVCVRVGTAYSREYVAILHDMVARNLTKPFRFWCVTDDLEPIHPGIEIIPANLKLDGWWQKLWLFSPEMPWALGERIVYFDLDTAIVGNLDEVVETKGIIRDWHVPGYNSSVMIWNHGEHAAIWEQFRTSAMDHLHGDQDWITNCAKAGDHWDIFPQNWFVSYRSHAETFPPLGSKAVCFHGKPKPHECGGWVPDVWKIGGLSEMVVPDGMNVSFDQALSNIKENAKRDIPWFVGSEPHKDTIVLVGGGPSMKAHVEAIRAHKQRGAHIVALNNTAAFLNSQGIIPDALIVIDARPENLAFIKADAKRYLLASQCDPSLFEALKDKDCHLFHAGICDEVGDLLEPYWETHPCVVIGGGGTVGLRAINLAIVSGYRKLHLYGYDSSFSDSLGMLDQHHAYPQALNDQDTTVEVFVPLLEKTYRCAVWMARQASEYRDMAYPAMKANGVKTWIHGTGLIPDLHRKLETSSASTASGGPSKTSGGAALSSPKSAMPSRGLSRSLAERTQ